MNAIKRLDIPESSWRGSSFNVPMSHVGHHSKASGLGQRTAARRSMVRLLFWNPIAREVRIAGSFNEWRPGATWMTHLDDGLWVKDLVLPPRKHRFCFVVDGFWSSKIEEFSTSMIPVDDLTPESACSGFRHREVVGGRWGADFASGFQVERNRKENAI
jgi:hypothetical protein